MRAQKLTEISAWNKREDIDENEKLKEQEPPPNKKTPRSRQSVRWVTAVLKTANFNRGMKE